MCVWLQACTVCRCVLWFYNTPQHSRYCVQLIWWQYAILSIGLLFTSFNKIVIGFSPCFRSSFWNQSIEQNFAHLLICLIKNLSIIINYSVICYGCIFFLQRLNTIEERIRLFVSCHFCVVEDYGVIDSTNIPYLYSKAMPLFTLKHLKNHHACLRSNQIACRTIEMSIAFRKKKKI